MLEHRGEKLMLRPEEEDLTKFDLNDLLNEVQKVADKMRLEGLTQKGADELSKLASRLKRAAAPRRPAQIAHAVRRIDKGVEHSRTNKLKDR